MSKIVKDIKVALDSTIEEKLKILEPNFSQFHILKQSIDARKRHAPHEVYTVEVFEKGEKPEKKTFELKKVKFKYNKPVIVGAGPAGLFCALRLVEQGIPCILLERGNPTEKRIFSINKFWRYGELDPNDNVCFGEGGAGFFSDGKLITRIKSEHIPYIMNRLVQFGAPPEIEYLSNPHIGSDKIRRIMPKIRQFLIQNGCEIHFNSIFKNLLISDNKVIGVETAGGNSDSKSYTSEHVVLATGHSSNSIFEDLHKWGVKLEGKSFAMGLRIEHSQEFINKVQYGNFFNHPKLKAANYKLTNHNDKTGIGVYSFCMCPGGYVLSSGTEPDGIVTNGMSNYNRNGNFANAAIVVSINHQKLFKNDLFGGLRLRRDLEVLCYNAVREAGGTKQIPAQIVSDFMNRKKGKVTSTSSPSGVVAIDFNEILPEFILKPLKASLLEFDKKMPGFISEKTLLHGIESRTSCPVRILRDDATLVSVSHRGLYPAGEGAGYAGGITSAAVDGVRIADAIANF